MKVTQHCIVWLGIVVAGMVQVTAAEKPAPAPPAKPPAVAVAEDESIGSKEPAGAAKPSAPASESTDSKEVEPPSWAKLPSPLNKVSCNIGDLEETGYFRITKAEFGREKELGEEALIWTVKVLKPLTCRHAMILLERFAESRFYRNTKKLRFDLGAAEVYYPSWFTLGTVTGQVLNQEEEFQVWVLLTDAQVRKLVFRKADMVVFGRPHW
jgi:hypothetical protein